MLGRDGPIIPTPLEQEAVAAEGKVNVNEPEKLVAVHVSVGAVDQVFERVVKVFPHVHAWEVVKGGRLGDRGGKALRRGLSPVGRDVDFEGNRRHGVREPRSATVNRVVVSTD